MMLVVFSGLTAILHAEHIVFAIKHGKIDSQGFITQSMANKINFIQKDLNDTPKIIFRNSRSRFLVNFKL